MHPNTLEEGGEGKETTRRGRVTLLASSRRAEEAKETHPRLKNWNGDVRKHSVSRQSLNGRYKKHCTGDCFSNGKGMPRHINNLLSSDVITHKLLENIQILLHIQSIMRSKLNWTALPISGRCRML